MELQHLDTQTQDGAQLNLDALYQICPSAFTEVKDEKTGELRRVVNWTTLRELLGDDAVEQADEMYQFTWPGKQQVRREAARPIDKTLRPVPEDSVDWDTTQNLYIEGDNLEVLKLLQKSYLGKVKMIYIDPPYNTGNDFVYDDDFSVEFGEWSVKSGAVDELGRRYRRNTDSNGRFHSDWCSMIYARLLVARSLLTEDGVIFISIDDNEVENLRKICDEVFGEGNFVADIIWKHTQQSKNDELHFSRQYNYTLCYSKNKAGLHRFYFARTEEDNKNYSNPDNDPKGLWRSGDVRSPNYRKTLCFDIFAPDGTVIKAPDNGWRWSEESIKEKIGTGEIIFKKDNSGIIRKIYLEDQPGRTPENLWEGNRFGTTRQSAALIKELFDGKQVFDTPKPIELVIRMLEISTHIDSLILDFFSGSATTAHAVMQLNAEDGGNRRFIMVQLPEETAEDSEARKAGYKNICEIGKERIRRAGKKIRESLECGELRVESEKQNSKLQSPNSKLDTGFRVFRIDDSNFTNVNRAPGEYNQAQLDLFLDNVKADRNDLDLLFGAMLAWGVELSLPLEVEEVWSLESGELRRSLENGELSVENNSKLQSPNSTLIYSVNDGDLVACFSENVSEAVIKAMADKQPLRVLFRDSCFTQDDQKINLFEQFKQLLDWSEEEAVKNIRVI